MYQEQVISVFGRGVYLYGICMAVGIICCFIFLMFTMDHKNFNEEATDKMLLFGIVATGIGILMAGVFQGIYDYIDDPSGGFSLSGLTFYGGLIGGVVSFLIFWNLYIYVVAPRSKHKLLQNHMNAGLLDAAPFVPIAIGIAHTFGRLGCTFAGCCYGMATDAWYGMVFSVSSSASTVVPTQLFESLFLMVLTIIMAILYFKFHFNCNMGVYCIGYGVFRFCIEYVRDDPRGSFIPGLTPSQFWAIIMVAIGIAYFFLYKYLFKKLMKHPELQERVNVKPEKSSAKFDRNAIIISAITVAAVILAVVGVCVNYVNVGTSTSRVFTTVSSYGLTDGALADIGGLGKMQAFAYLTLALCIVNAAVYAAYRVFDKQPLRIASQCISFILLISAIAAILTACSNDVAGTLSSYVMRAGTGAWILAIGAIASAAAVFGGTITPLKKSKEPVKAEV